MKPRYYQTEAKISIFDYFTKEKGNPLVALPTGTGKSLVIADFIVDALKYYPTTRVIMVTHVKELITQNMEKLVLLWPTAPAGIYSSGLKKKQSGYQITYAGIQSCANKPELFSETDLILVDEAHLIPHKQNTLYRKFINAIIKSNPKVKVIGFTATPYRMGQGMLTDEGGIFTDICYNLTGMSSFNRLIDEGFLAPLVAKRPALELDVTGVKLAGGDFVLNQLQKAVDQDAITERAVDEIIEQGDDRKKWLVFASGVDHAINVKEMFDRRGVSCAVVHSKLADGERDQLIADYKAGVYRAMVNNNILTTGFDAPDIDLIAVLRPTMSPNLWVQMLGRGTRPCIGKEDCLVLDFAGNTRRLGPINDPVLPKKRGKGGKGEAPVRVCEHCGTYNHISKTHCENCGEEFPKQTRLVENASSDELIRKPTAPQVEVFKVNNIVYNRNPGRNAPDSLKVTYTCGLRFFNEWVCFEHAGFAGKKARDWWRVRAEGEIPETITTALNRISDLDAPAFVRVWINKKYPEIMDYSFDIRGFPPFNTETKPLHEAETLK